MAIAAPPPKPRPGEPPGNPGPAPGVGEGQPDPLNHPEVPMIRLTLPLLALIALTACETVKGAGRDLQTTGSAISSEAAEAQSEM